MNSALKVKVEIWSDIMCPFCYIGKRKYEAAVQKLKDPEILALEWHSYLLDPSIPSGETERMDYFTYLQDRKNMGREQITDLFKAVTAMGVEVGLQFNFDKIIVANSLNAHRLLHLAKSKGLANEAEELLFEAHFTDGVDIDDKEALILLGRRLEIDENELRGVLESDQYAYEVNQDIREAENIGVRGVPFFVFDRKYGISGAQPTEVFSETIEKAVAEWRQDNPVIHMQGSEGNSCDADGNCV